MKTKIIKIENDWRQVLNTCRMTVNRECSDKDPSASFKNKILLAEHSPIRQIRVTWEWQMKSWIAVHWVRHKFEKYVSSRRDDRFKSEYKSRDDMPQGIKVTFVGCANAQSLIDVWRKRLCYCAHAETREYAEDFKAALREYEPELSDALVPNCVYRGGCPEFKTCGFWNNFIHKSTVRYAGTDLDLRYAVYNMIFYERRGKK